jgi:hypothetical protein
MREYIGWWRARDTTRNCTQADLFFFFLEGQETFKMNVPLFLVIYRGGGDGGAQPKFYFILFFFVCEGRNESLPLVVERIYLNIAVSWQVPFLSLPSFHAADDARRTTMPRKKQLLLYESCVVLFHD